MKAIYLLVLGGAIFLTGCGDNTSQKSAQVTNAEPRYDTGNPVTAPVDYLGAVGQAQKYAIKQIDLAQINQAIMFFHEAEDRYPNDLNELVAKHYLGEIPQAPYGMKIVYNSTDGSVKVVKQ